MIIAHVVTFIVSLPAYNHVQLSFCLGLAIDSEVDVVLVQILRASGIDLMLAFLAPATADPRAHTRDPAALMLGVEAVSGARLNYLRFPLL